MPPPRTTLGRSLVAALALLGHSACSHDSPWPATPKSHRLTLPAGALPVAVGNVRWNGRVAGRDWVLAERARDTLRLYGLAHGAIVTVDLPRELGAGPLAVCGREAFLWIVVTDTTGPTIVPKWMSIDLREPAAPVLSPLVTLEALGPHAPERIAIGGTRALIYLSEKQLVPWDVEAMRPVAPPVQYDGGINDRPELHCDEDRCMAIGVEDKARQLVLRRFAADGQADRVVLVDGEMLLDDSATVSVGHAVLAVWLAGEGIFARRLPFGGPIAAPVLLEGGAQKGAYSLRIATGAAGTWLASHGLGWTLAKLRADGRGLESPTLLPFDRTKVFFLSLAVVDAGVVIGGFSNRVTYVDGMHYSLSSAQAIFTSSRRVPTSSDVVDLVDRVGGAGQAGFTVFPLTEPGAAGVLVAPHQGDYAGYFLLQRRVMGAAD